MSFTPALYKFGGGFFGGFIFTIVCGNYVEEKISEYFVKECVCPDICITDFLFLKPFELPNPSVATGQPRRSELPSSH